jgi:hypothetical protein
LETIEAAIRTQGEIEAASCEGISFEQDYMGRITWAGLHGPDYMGRGPKGRGWRELNLGKGIGLWMNFKPDENWVSDEAARALVRLVSENVRKPLKNKGKSAKRWKPCKAQGFSG